MWNVGSKALLCAWSIVFLTMLHAPVRAAQIEFRPELLERLAGLRSIYPSQGPASILGNESPITTLENDVDQVRTAADPAGSTVIEITGIIDKGDAAKLERLLRTPKFLAGIVFDSPGGNFLEGFAIAEKIRYVLESQDPNVGGVYVLNGGKCLSACAIAFALSVDLVHEANDGRYIETGAQLGFHVGFLPGEKAEQVGRVGDVLNLSYDIAAAFNKLLIGGANPPRLLREALKHRSANSFYMLRGGLNSWNMGFSPVAKGLLSRPVYGYGLDHDLAARLCNAYMLAGRAFKSGVDLEYGLFFPGREVSGVLLMEVAESEGSGVLSTGSAHGIFSCQIQIRKDKKVRIALWRGETGCAAGPVNPRGKGWCAGKPRVSKPVRLGLLADTLGCSNGRYVKGTEFQKYKRPGSIKREVNMRSAPTLDGEVLERLQPSLNVEIVNCSVKPDSQGVWFKIKTDNRTGWVSARFVFEKYNGPGLPID
ncbi:MAG: SH3 domain-containing protein [Rhizobiales bacterium]|nr:SH3 domain-containing protein [Hyphomicrobiales bacterium]